MLDAFESVAAALSGATLHLVGKGSHGAALEARAALGRAGSRVVFHGGLAREALPDYYRAAGDKKKLKDALLKMVELKPGDGKLRYQAAQQLEQMGERDAAIGRRDRAGAELS